MAIGNQMRLKFKTYEDYLQKTEHAVRQFYDGLASCWSYYQKALNHWDITKIKQPLTPENKTALETYLKLAGKYFDLKFSEATFAGSILQVAYMGIRYFSRNKTIPESCKDIVLEKNNRAIPFCIGKRIYGLPCGLIIYGARNQYNHWDDEKPRIITQKVFDVLYEAFSENALYDFAFDLDNPSITIYANEVLLGVLQWHTYDHYLSEMQALLQKA
jgi:hypothetical protein